MTNCDDKETKNIDYVKTYIQGAIMCAVALPIINQEKFNLGRSIVHGVIGGVGWVGYEFLYDKIKSVVFPETKVQTQDKCLTGKVISKEEDKVR